MAKTTKPTKPLAGYVRVSRKGDRDDESLRSPDFQREAIERYAKAEGLEVTWFTPEIDVSGSKPKRVVLDEIIRLVESGALGGIIVAKLNRLSRLKPKDRILLFEQIEEPGGVILSASEQLDPSTPEGRFQRELFLSLARMQWEQYREGFETAKEGAISNGIPVHSHAPAGYRHRSGKRERVDQLELDPRTAPIIREVFERRARGEGPVALGTFLTENGVTTSHGSPAWSKQAIYGLIGNRIYLGELAYGVDRRYVNAEAHEPIVDMATWQAAQKPNAGLTPSRSANGTAWLLTGIARCRGCGYSLQGTAPSNRRRVYRCNKRHAGGVCPEPAYIKADVLEEIALHDFWTLSAELEAIGTRDDRGRTDELRAALDRSERRLGQLLSQDVQDAIGDTPEWARRLREARDARDDDAAALGRAEAEAQTAEPMPSSEELRAAWGDMTPAERRELLALRFDCIAVGRGGTVVAFGRGSGPADLPTRGFTKNPRLTPIVDVPDGARILAA